MGSTTRWLAIALLVSVAALAPTGQAGTSLPPTPASVGCVLVDTDACTEGPFTSTQGLYAYSFSGVFTGTVSASVTGGGYTSTFTCTGTIAGGLILNGGCVAGGSFPPAGVPMTLACTSSGSGNIACTLEGV